MTKSTARRREDLLDRMVGRPIPRLWCPPLTHYTPEGDIDAQRMRAHWQTMCEAVGGFLVPGSTGDGWEMTETEITEVLRTASDLAVELDTLLLVGVLRTEVDAMLDVIHRTVRRLKDETGEDEALIAFTQRHIAGFTICPPQGSDLSQVEIHRALARVLELGYPTAVYQLPQVTENEISATVFRDLATDYPNLILFKDSSGQDRVALSDEGESGVFLMRGAEGNYARWLRKSGGCYDGLLLSTANCFARELGQIITWLEEGRTEDADELSRRLTDVVNAVFATVADLEQGNAFANANKAMDHFMAHGPDAVEAKSPLLHTGIRLPQDVMHKTKEILERGNLLPADGYLNAD
ncbi:MAG: dihydrodipicolinate synthase family protein [Anaerolineae bacterium]